MFSCPLSRKEMEEPELVFSDEANKAIPQMVIKFYESKLTWNEVPEEEQSRYNIIENVARL